MNTRKNKNQKIKVAKKVSGKRRWYFRYKRVKTSTVLRNVGHIVGWQYYKRSRNAQVSITFKNVKNLVAVSREDYMEAPYKWLRLNIIDGWILYKWLRLRKINLDQLKGEKLCILNNPLIHPDHNRDMIDLHFFCLEQNPDYTESWLWKIRANTYINGEINRYKILCLPVG